MRGILLSQTADFENSQRGDTQVSGGWRVLARQKLLEVEQRMQRMARMKHILEEALRQDLNVEEAIDLFQPLLP
jgi:hypothetical protein